MTENINLELLKQEYFIFKEKYDIPEFEKLNEFFDIEEIDVESDFLLRKIRRIISERIAGYLRFSETMLNPSNAPLFFFKLIKKLDENDREKLKKIYEKLGKYEIEIIKRDLKYSEEKEAEFIKKSYEIFDKQISKEFLEIIKKIENGDSDYKENNNSYCG